MLLKAYAKVNLVLKVLGKNDYNYHNLQMLNAKIDLYDQIDVKKNNKKNDLVKFRGLNQENIKDDLVLRCINIIKNYYNIDDCFDITITKQIPIGAGMGGGSCDVATIVKYLLRRYHIEEDLNQLIHLLKDQSADIPYCLTNKIAFVEGIGEKVSEIFVAIPNECILVNPHISISTKEVFEKVKGIIVEQLGVADTAVTLEASFIDDLGADSLDIVELVMALEEEFDIEIPDADAEKVVTVGDVVDYIKENV